jgi:hypothetical protein
MERAEELLFEYIAEVVDNSNMFDANEDGGGTYFSSEKYGQKMRLKLFNLVLKGWSKAPPPEAAIRAEGLLLSMKQAKVKPNGASFQYVLDAWRKTNKHKKIQDRSQPKVEEVIAFLDREKRHIGGSKKLYPTLRKNWKLLSIR